MQVVGTAIGRTTESWKVTKNHSGENHGIFRLNSSSSGNTWQKKLMSKRLKHLDIFLFLLFPLFLAKFLSDFLVLILCVCEPVHLFHSLSLFEWRAEMLAKR